MVNLKRFHDGVKVNIEREGRVVANMGEGAKYYEKVLIHYKMPQGENSFRALVDPKSARLLRTWDRTIHENFRRFRLSPDYKE